MPVSTKSKKNSTKSTKSTKNVNNSSPKDKASSMKPDDLINSILERISGISFGN